MTKLIKTDCLLGMFYKKNGDIDKIKKIAKAHVQIWQTEMEKQSPKTEQGLLR